MRPISSLPWHILRLFDSSTRPLCPSIGEEAHRANAHQGHNDTFASNKTLSNSLINSLINTFKYVKHCQICQILWTAHPCDTGTSGTLAPNLAFEHFVYIPRSISLSNHWSWLRALKIKTFTWRLHCDCMRPQIGAWNQEGQVALGILHGFQVMSHGRDKIMGAAEKCRGQQVPCLAWLPFNKSVSFHDVPWCSIYFGHHNCWNFAVPTLSWT